MKNIQRALNPIRPNAYISMLRLICLTFQVGGYDVSGVPRKGRVRMYIVLTQVFFGGDQTLFEIHLAFQVGVTHTHIYIYIYIYILFEIRPAFSGYAYR